MRLLVVAAAAVSLTACAAPPPNPAEVDRDFVEQAEAVAGQWRDGEAAQSWSEGLVLADRPIRLPKDWPEPQYFDEPNLMSGDVRLDAELPDDTPPATVTLPGSTLDVEPWDAGRAYDILTDVDGSSGDPRFVVVEVEAGTEPWYTNHGFVELPVWKYTMDGYTEPVLQVAFDVETASPLPRVSAPDTGFASAAGLDTVDGTTLSFDVAASCLVDVEPLVHETDDLILLGGTGTATGDDECLPEYETVTVELERVPGHRVIIDAVDGDLLRFNEIYGM